MSRTEAMLATALGHDLGRLANQYFRDDTDYPHCIARAGDYERCAELEGSYDITQALIDAYFYDYWAIIDMLAAKGEGNLNNVLAVLCTTDRIDLVRHIIALGADAKYGMIYACECGTLEIVKLIIEHGYNDWDTCLWHACMGSHVEVVQFMLDRGANPTMGMRAARHALSRSCIRLMAEHGAD